MGSLVFPLSSSAGPFSLVSWEGGPTYHGQLFMLALCQQICYLEAAFRAACAASYYLTDS